MGDFFDTMTIVVVIIMVFIVLVIIYIITFLQFAVKYFAFRKKVK